MTLPNILTLIRLALGFMLLAIAWLDREMIFVGVLILAFFLDLIDAVYKGNIWFV